MIIRTIKSNLTKTTILTVLLVIGLSASAQERLWQKSALIGNIEAQYNNGVCYLYGHHRYPKNLDSAAYWFIQCAKGSDEFCGEIGRIFLREDVPGGIEKIQPYLKRAAANGDFASNMVLSYYKAMPKPFKKKSDKDLYMKYIYIQNGSLSYTEIWDKKEMSRLIKMGHPLALVLQAHDYYYFKGKKKQAVKLVVQAVDCDYPWAMCILPWWLDYISKDEQQNNTEAMALLTMAANMGCNLAYSKLASVYFNGWFGQTVDKSQAYQWYHKIIYDKKGELVKNPNSLQANVLYTVAVNYYGGDREKQIEMMRKADINKYTNAHEWLLKNTDIYTTTAEWYSRGVNFYNKEQYEEGIKAFRHIGKKNAITMYYLGQCFQNSKGPLGNNDSAFYWYTQAYERRSEIGAESWKACYFLAGCYRIGRGTHRNLKEARRLFQEARDLATLSSQKNMIAGTISEINREINTATALFNEGMKLHELGDNTGAFTKFKEAAECGHKESQNNLGVCYNSGEGTAQNEQEAIYWYRQAAIQGEKTAIRNLGISLLKSNPSEAIIWLKKAADNGDSKVYAKLGRCYEEGDGVQKNVATALEYYRKGATAGDAEAIYWLGHCYEDGVGVPKDITQAIQLYRKSAEKNNIRANFVLAMCYYSGKGVPENKEQAIKYMRKAASSSENSFLASYAEGILNGWLKEK